MIRSSIAYYHYYTDKHAFLFFTQRNYVAFDISSNVHRFLIKNVFRKLLLTAILKPVENHSKCSEQIVNTKAF